MAVSGRVALRLGNVGFLLLVQFACTFHQVRGESFGSLVTGTISLSTGRNTTDLNHAVDADSFTCATIEPYTRVPLVYIGVSSSTSIKTIVLYLPQGTTHANIEISIARKTFSFTKEMTQGNHTITVWTEYYSTYKSAYIGVRGKQDLLQLSVCYIKAYDVRLETYCECSDPCSRNQDIICQGVCSDISPAGCNMMNVALHKSANMSSRYRTASASYAVNGITGTTFSGPGYTNDTTLWNCVHSDPNVASSYWLVDLGTQYTIRDVTIYRRHGKHPRYRMADVTITVDEKTCREITYDDMFRNTFGENERMNVDCHRPYPTGRIVKLLKQGVVGSHDGSSLNLCEVQIWVCKPGYFGFGCTQMCSDGCLMNKCDVVNGYCTSGCKAGRYNPTCSAECGSGCPAGECDPVNGTCHPCIDNWAGDKCEDCDSQHHGINCSRKCGNCYNGTSCGRYDGGICPRSSGIPRCQPGFRGYKCVDECTPSQHGPDCKGVCGAGCEKSSPTGRQCDVEHGHCSCRPGWKRSDQWCNTWCDSGTYGVDCVNNCSTHCHNTCDRITGHCTCRLGYQPPLCFSACVSGTYGYHCGKKCSAGCQSQTPGGSIPHCDTVTGHCSCRPGWNSTDPMCETPCEDGYYGNCSSTCGKCEQNKVCDPATGHCPEGRCEKGFVSPLCAEKLVQGKPVSDKNAQVTPIILGIVFAVLIIGCAVALFAFIRWKKGRVNGPARLVSDTAADGKRPYAEPGDKERLYANTNDGERLYANTGDKERLYANAGEKERLYANTLEMSAVCKASSANGNDHARLRPDQASSSQINDLDEDNLLDISQEEVEDREDDRWSEYQSIKISLDPLQRHLLDRLTDTSSLRAEFKELPTGLTKPYTVGSLEVNKPKNRFKRLFPYDHTRVVLTQQSTDPSSDYINANFIRNLNDEMAYIATQGPLKNTVGDLWRMVWQEGVSQIVMLTNIMEKDKAKCHKYWPEKGERQTHDGITVVGEDVQLRADFYIRSFQIHKAKTSTPRTVTQYHMVVWPDHGVPSALSLLNLVRFVSFRTEYESGPLLVHCSAGVGRTGTCIALDMLMQQMEQKGSKASVDVFETVKRMREDRVIMIQTVDQYVFLHEALLETYASIDTRLKLEQLDSLFPDPVTALDEHPRLDREFKILCQMKHFLCKPKYTLATMAENKAKNRDSSVLADDAHLAYLSAHVSGRNQYINAVSMPSFRQQRGMLLTQLPLPDTVVDLWRLVESFDVTNIVSLGSLEEEKKKDFCHYWPRVEKNPLKTGPYVIKMTSSQILGESLTSYSLTIEKRGKAARSVCLLHLTNWEAETPAKTSDLVHLLGKVDSIQSQDMATPIIVQCRDGATRSGLFSALTNIISRLTYDRELDVYLTVRHVQAARPQAVASAAQYRFLYQVALEYKKNFDVYANA